MPAAALRTAVAVLCLLGLLGASGCGGSAGASVGQQDSLIAAHHRKAAPSGIAGRTIINGDQFDLADHRGHVVVINFWASWCPPCRDETQSLDQVAADTRAEGVTFIGVDFDGDGADGAAAKAFMVNHHVPYDSLFDKDSELVLKFRGKVPIKTPPTTVVIDKQGRIAAIHPGQVFYTTLKSLVSQVNAEPA